MSSKGKWRDTFADQQARLARSADDLVTVYGDQVLTMVRRVFPEGVVPVLEGGYVFRALADLLPINETQARTICARLGLYPWTHQDVIFAVQERFAREHPGGGVLPADEEERLLADACHTGKLRSAWS